MVDISGLRTCLRVLPFSVVSQGNNENPGHGDDVTLALCRIVLSSCCAAIFENHELWRKTTTLTASDALLDDAYHGIPPMMHVTDMYLDYLKYMPAPMLAISDDSLSILTESNFQAQEDFLIAIHYDHLSDEKMSSVRQALTEPLWHHLYDKNDRRAGKISEIIEDQLFAFFDMGGEQWTYWERWYRKLLSGQPINWELALKVAEIEERDWDKGYEHIAKLIAEIEARLALAEGIQNLRATDRKIAEITLPKRDHNNPPELIDEPQIAGRVEIVWSALETLGNEAKADNPDSDKAREALLVVRNWFFAACKYAGRKADLAIDTSIKWVIPAVGGGYLVTHPEKLAEIIQLAETWLRLP